MKSNMKKVRIMLDVVMPVAILLLFVPPCMTWYAGKFMPLVYLFQKIIFLICVFYFFKYRLFDNKYFVLLLIYIIWIILVTYIRGNSLAEIGSYLNIFSLCTITIYCLERDPLKYTGFVSAILTLLLFINTLLWKEGGMYINSNGQMGFVLGTKTSLTEYQIVACCYIGLFYALLPNKRKFNAVILWLMVFLSIVIWNIFQPISTSILCLVLFFGLMIWQKFRTKVADIVLKYGFGIMLILNIGIVFFNAQIFFGNFITEILHESADLNKRTLIWQVVLKRIYDSPVIGHGVNTNTYFAIGGGIAGINQATHNCLLYLIFISGILGTLYFLALCFNVLYKSGIDTVAGRIFHISLMCFGMLWITEQLKGFELFFICILAGVCINSVAFYAEE